jgi:hypothetical protein
VGAKLFHADGETNRQMYRHDEVNSCFSQLCKRAYKTKVIENILQMHLVTVEMAKKMSRRASHLLSSMAANTIHLYVYKCY